MSERDRQPTYRFRSNGDLKRYLAAMKDRADRLRCQASDLLMKASAIDSERDHLEQELIEVKMGGGVDD